jgi:hypothetical protein
MDGSMSDEKDNVIPFPSHSELTDPEKRAARGRAAWQQIQKNRAEGFEKAVHKIELFDNPERKSVTDTQTEERLRDIEGALRGIVLSLESTSVMVDGLISDAISTMREQQAMGSNFMAIECYMDAMLGVFKEKGILTQEELDGFFDQKVKPKLEEVAKALTTPKDPK